MSKSPKWIALAIGLGLILPILLLRCLGGQEDSKARTARDNSSSQMESSSSGEERSSAQCGGEDLTPARELFGLKSVIILLGSPDLESYKKIEKAVRENGGRITTQVPPEVIFALIPGEKESVLKGLREIEVISSAAVDLSTLPGLHERKRKFLEKWNQQLSHRPAPSLVPRPEPPPDDALERRPPVVPEQIEPHPPKSLPKGLSPEGSQRSYLQAPELAFAPTVAMSGTVALAIFFPESNGGIDANQENWTADQVSKVVAEISAGVNWWAALAPAGSNLNFVISYYDPLTEACLQTSYEPITRSSTAEGLWIDQIMTCLGYASGAYSAKVDSFNTWLKGQQSAAEAYSVFVVDDELDADHMFTNGRFAFAYLGGPFEVMTYNNDGYGSNNMDAVHAHETGHIFHALDEYYQPGYAVCSCTGSYNGCVNQNCANNCPFNLDCIMRGQVAPYTNNSLCDCTKGQIGWGCGSCNAGGGGGLNCSSKTVLTPGQAYAGKTSGGYSDVSSYNCAAGWNESGPEKVFSITTGAVGNITAQLNNLGADLDVFILSACDEDSCLAYGNTGATYLNAPAGAYEIVVDGSNGASGNFTLTVTFLTSNACAYTVLAPKGGENWRVGSKQRIKWNFAQDCSQYVRIQYSTRGPNGPWKTLKKKKANNGIMAWTVPDKTSRKARVKITDYYNAGLFDLSDGNFKISP